MNTVYGQLQGNMYKALRDKMASGNKLTLADIEDIALFDVALNRCLMNCRMSGFSLQDTLIACVFVLAEQKHVIGDQLVECHQRNGTGHPIVIMDKDGEALERFRVMAKEGEEKE